MPQVEFSPEAIAIKILLARMHAGVKVGQEITAEITLWPRVEENGEVVELLQVVREALREAVEVALEREAGS